jgi:RHS repeat-associated protein
VVTAVNKYDEYSAPAAGNTGRFQYTGQMWLAELGLYHYKARAYSPVLGRFLQTDPAKYYNAARTHLSLEKDAPISRAKAFTGRIKCAPHVGGLHREYARI